MPQMLLRLLQKKQFKTVEVTGDLVGNKLLMKMKVQVIL